MDIAFGDCVSVGGFRYALILVDRATRYNWVYGLKDLSVDSILSALRYFKADAGSYARCFRSDCDTKLFGTRIREHLIDNNSNIVATAAGRQSANGLVESHWKTMVHMSRAYKTEKQMPRSFWFFLVVHSARMMNAIPGKCWRLLFFWSMVLDMMNVLGFQYSRFATSIMTGTGMWHGCTPRLIQWTASPLVDHLIQCAFGSQSTDEEILRA
jgi:hypothetical protein